MSIRINEAIQLHNFRRERDNKENGRPLSDGKLKKNEIAVLLWPDSKPDRALIYLSRISRTMQKVAPEWVRLIAWKCGVDCNFVLGTPSVHDEEFKEYEHGKESNG